MTSEKLISRERHQKSPTYGHVARLFLASEFKHKGINKRKKTQILSNLAGFLGSNRFRKYKYSNTARKRAIEKFGKSCHRKDRNLPLKFVCDHLSLAGRRIFFGSIGTESD